MGSQGVTSTTVEKVGRYPFAKVQIPSSTPSTECKERSGYRKFTTNHTRTVLRKMSEDSYDQQSLNLSKNQSGHRNKSNVTPRLSKKF